MLARISLPRALSMAPVTRRLWPADCVPGRPAVATARTNNVEQPSRGGVVSTAVSASIRFAFAGRAVAATAVAVLLTMLIAAAAHAQQPARPQIQTTKV